MTNDNFYKEESFLRGIKGVRWLMYVRDIKPMNDPIFIENKVEDSKTSEEVTICYSSSQSFINPETPT